MPTYSYPLVALPRELQIEADVVVGHGAIASGNVVAMAPDGTTAAVRDSLTGELRRWPTSMLFALAPPAAMLHAPRMTYVHHLAH